MSPSSLARLPALPRSQASSPGRLTPDCSLTLRPPLTPPPLSSNPHQGTPTEALPCPPTFVSVLPTDIPCSSIGHLPPTAARGRGIFPHPGLTRSQPAFQIGELSVGVALEPQNAPQALTVISSHLFRNFLNGDGAHPARPDQGCWCLCVGGSGQPGAVCDLFIRPLCAGGSVRSSLNW